MVRGSRASSMTEVDANKTLRVAVVGAGVFGRNHLRVYRELERAGYKVELAAVIDPNEAARKRAEAEFGVRGFATIAASLNEVDAIAAVARERGRMVQVGHLERFNPAVRAVRGMLNRPMFFEVH